MIILRAGLKTFDLTFRMLLNDVTGNSGPDTCFFQFRRRKKKKTGCVCVYLRKDLEEYQHVRWESHLLMHVAFRDRPCANPGVRTGCTQPFTRRDRLEWTDGNGDGDEMTRDACTELEHGLVLPSGDRVPPHWKSLHTGKITDGARFPSRSGGGM